MSQWSSFYPTRNAGFKKAIKWGPKRINEDISQRTSKLLEKPVALKREHPVLQKMKLINCFLFFWAIFALLKRIRIANPDPDPGTPLNPDTDPDPQHCL
jgi:hypothetical protein